MQTIEAFDLMVNGGAVRVPAGLTVAGLLDQLGLDRRKVAVERNEEIVPRSGYDTLVLGGADQSRDRAFHRRGLAWTGS